MKEIKHKPTVLLVDDERAYVDAYATWLAGDYDIRIAENGTEALQQLSTEIDVVLLDRRMPDVTGEKVLTQIRDRQLDCKVAVVTAIEPEFDILNMEFDEYLVKPVTKAELQHTIEELLLRNKFSQEIQRGFALASKKTTIESQHSQTQLENNKEYQTLLQELENVEANINESINELIDTGKVVTAYRDI